LTVIVVATIVVHAVASLSSSRRCRCASSLAIVATFVVVVVASLSSSRRRHCVSWLAIGSIFVATVASAKHRNHGQLRSPLQIKQN
jgi:hypothetical protein